MKVGLWASPVFPQPCAFSCTGADAGRGLGEAGHEIPAASVEQEVRPSPDHHILSAIQCPFLANCVHCIAQPFGAILCSKTSTAWHSVLSSVPATAAALASGYGCLVCPLR